MVESNMPSPAATSSRVIKKYQNRKLYDMKDSCYVTLADIAEMIRRSEEITVIDNETKDDVTVLILTQILYDQEKTKKMVLPISILKAIIQSGSGSVYDVLHKYAVGGLESPSATQVELEKYVDRLVKKGDLSKGEAKSLLTDLATVVSHNLDTVVSKIEARLASNFQNGSPLDAIKQTMHELNQRLDALDKRLTAHEKQPTGTPNASTASWKNSSVNP